MRIRNLMLLVVAVVTAAMAFASVASATSLRDGSATGGLVPAGWTLSGTQEGTSSLVMPGFGTISCTAGQFSSTVTSNTVGGASVKGTLDTLTFTSCTDNIFGLSFTSCHLTSAPANGVTGTAASSNNGDGTVHLSNTVVTCIGNTSCAFTAATASGNYTFSATTLAFSGVAATSNGGGLCPPAGTAGTFSSAYHNVVLQNTAGTMGYLTTN